MRGRVPDLRQRQRLQLFLLLVGKSVVALCAVLMIWVGLQYILGEVVRIALQPSRPAERIHPPASSVPGPGNSFDADEEFVASMAPSRAAASRESWSKLKR
jgi:hypothetical protein